MTVLPCGVQHRCHPHAPFGLVDLVAAVDEIGVLAARAALVADAAEPFGVDGQAETLALVRQQGAGQLAAPLFRMGREWQVNPTDRGFRYESDLMTLDLPAPALAGAHQIDNAATAVACVERLRAANFEIDDAAIRKGLAAVEWPARLQRLTRGPLVDALPPGCELWLDGGHNADGGRAIANALADLEERIFDRGNAPMSRFRVLASRCDLNRLAESLGPQRTINELLVRGGGPYRLARPSIWISSNQ